MNLTGFENIVRQGEPLAMHTWFQLGGPAEYFAEPESTDQLTALVRRCHEEEVGVRLLGQGSNILVRDEGVPGMVIRLSAPVFCEIRIDGRKIMAGGGALLGRSVTTAVHRGLAGLETLIGIPGTVGGALHGNAGTHGGNIGQWTLDATVLTASGEICQRGSDELVFGYRQSSLDDLVILEASCELEEDNPRELAQRMQRHWIVKKASQPMGHQSAGCVFKNPPRPERRRVDRPGRSEEYADRRGRRQRPPRELHHRRARMHGPGRAPADRTDPQPGSRSVGRRTGTRTRDLVIAWQAEFSIFPVLPPPPGPFSCATGAEGWVFSLKNADFSDFNESSGHEDSDNGAIYD